MSSRVRDVGAEPDGETDRERVLAHLARRDAIARATREAIEARNRGRAVIEPLADVPAEVRQAAEDEFYGAQGRTRYVTSDGRTLFLTPAEIERRRGAHPPDAKRRQRRRASAYNQGGDPRDRWVGLGFNVGVVLLALVVVAMLVR